MGESHGIEIKFSGIDSHNSVGVGERYHGPLRHVLRIAREKYPSLDPEVTLRYVIESLMKPWDRRELYHL